MKENSDWALLDPFDEVVIVEEEIGPQAFQRDLTIPDRHMNGAYWPKPRSKRPR